MLNKFSPRIREIRYFKGSHTDRAYSIHHLINKISCPYTILASWPYDAQLRQRHFKLDNLLTFF